MIPKWFPSGTVSKWTHENTDTDSDTRTPGEREEIRKIKNVSIESVDNAHALYMYARPNFFTITLRFTLLCKYEISTFLQKLNTWGENIFTGIEGNMYDL